MRVGMVMLVISSLVAGCDWVFRIDEVRIADAPHPTTWTLRRVVGDGLDGPSARMTVPAANAGDLVVVGIWMLPGSYVVSVADNAGSTYQGISGTAITNGRASLEIWYTNASAAGATELSFQASDALAAALVWQVGDLPAATIEDADAIASTGLDVAGPMLEAKSPGAFAVAFTVVEWSVSNTASNGDFVQDWLYMGNSWAHRQPGAPAGLFQPAWTQMARSGEVAVSAAVFGP